MANSSVLEGYVVPLPILRDILPKKQLNYSNTATQKHSFLKP